jgi:hypothetical protein
VRGTNFLALSKANSDSSTDACASAHPKGPCQGYAQDTLRGILRKCAVMGTDSGSRSDIDMSIATWSLDRGY